MLVLLVEREKNFKCAFHGLMWSHVVARCGKRCRLHFKEICLLPSFSSLEVDKQTLNKGDYKPLTCSHDENLVYLCCVTSSVMQDWFNLDRCLWVTNFANVDALQSFFQALVGNFSSIMSWTSVCRFGPQKTLIFLDCTKTVWPRMVCLWSNWNEKGF